MSSRNVFDDTGSLNSARICAYGLFSNVRHHVQPAAVRHPDQDVAMPASAGLGDHLVEDRHQHVEPSIEKRVLPGNVRCRNRSNASTCVSRSSSATGSIGSAGRGSGRARPPCAASALLGHEHVRVVVAGRRAVDAAERLDHVVCRWRPRERRRDQAGRQARRSSSVTPCSRRESDGSPIGGAPERIEPGREVPVAADRLRQVDRADDLVERDPPSAGAGSSTSGRAASTAGRARAWRGRPTRVAAVLLVQLQDIAAVQPCEVPPRRHNLIIVTASFTDRGVDGLRGFNKGSKGSRRFQALRGVQVRGEASRQRRPPFQRLSWNLNRLNP